MASVEYYESDRLARTLLLQSEQKRLMLERDLQRLINSNRQMSDVKRARLQSYWKKLCEEEVSRKQRNDKILEELAESETHRSQLSAQSEKLRLAKMRYESYINRLYPHWHKWQLEQRTQQRTINNPPSPLGRHRSADGRTSPFLYTSPPPFLPQRGEFSSPGQRASLGSTAPGRLAYGSQRSGQGSDAYHHRSRAQSPGGLSSDDGGTGEWSFRSGDSMLGSNGGGNSRELYDIRERPPIFGGNRLLTLSPGDRRARRDDGIDVRRSMESASSEGRSPKGTSLFEKYSPRFSPTASSATLSNNYGHANGFTHTEDSKRATLYGPANVMTTGTNGNRGHSARLDSAPPFSSSRSSIDREFTQANHLASIYPGYDPFAYSADVDKSLLPEFSGMGRTGENSYGQSSRDENRYGEQNIMGDGSKASGDRQSLVGEGLGMFGNHHPTSDWSGGQLRNDYDTIDAHGRQPGGTSNSIHSAPVAVDNRRPSSSRPLSRSKPVDVGKRPSLTSPTHTMTSAHSSLSSPNLTESSYSSPSPGKHPASISGSSPPDKRPNGQAVSSPPCVISPTHSNSTLTNQKQVSSGKSDLSPNHEPSSSIAVASPVVEGRRQSVGEIQSSSVLSVIVPGAGQQADDDDNSDDFSDPSLPMDGESNDRRPQPKPQSSNRPAPVIIPQNLLAKSDDMTGSTQKSESELSDDLSPKIRKTVDLSDTDAYKSMIGGTKRMTMGIAEEADGAGGESSDDSVETKVKAEVKKEMKSIYDNQTTIPRTFGMTKKEDDDDDEEESDDSSIDPDAPMGYVPSVAVKKASEVAEQDKSEKSGATGGSANATDTMTGGSKSSFMASKRSQFKTGSDIESESEGEVAGGKKNEDDFFDFYE